MTKSKNLVLFDIDGTLLRRAGPHHKQALIEGIRRATGLATHLEGVGTSGMLDRDLITVMLRAAGQSERRVRAVLQDVVNECQDAYLNNCAEDLRSSICPGMPEFLEVLNSRGAVLGLVTGNLSRIGWKKMELAGLREYFSVGAFAEDGKTRARLAQVAAQRAKREGLVARDCRIALIGDHPNDVAAAKANGFLAIAVATGVGPREELEAAGPDILVETVSDLPLEAVS